MVPQYSLHDADSWHAMQDLWSLGQWIVAWDCSGADWLFGRTADGRPAYVLRSEAMASEPDDEETIDAMYELCQAAGVVRLEAGGACDVA
jgi:hypothetical protein